MELTYKGDLNKLCGSSNIAKMLPAADLSAVGLDSLQGYTDDKASRAEWERWYADALKMAMQVKEEKSFPWPKASNIKFPLLTIAALNGQAKAYPAIVSGDNVVKCRPLGKDPDGEKNARAVRVGKHMSYQLLECSSWEEQTDKLLLVLWIVGTAFKKTCRDNNRRENYSDLVLPQDLVVNYWATDLESASRVSHRFSLTKNELRENINAKLYREPEGGDPSPPPTGPLEAAKDLAQKTQPTQDKNIHFLIEQSRFIDLDGDGYEEPYAVTFDESTGFVYRIIARYYPSDIKREQKAGQDDPKGKLLRIEAENYYTKFGLIPSPDGGFYDIGLGLLLGPLAESASTLINQITDWATMNILSGGFLGRGVRMKAGETTFKPLEWKTVDSTGDDLHKNIVPLPVKELSPVLLDLLKFLVNYGERIAGSGDIQVGEIPGQNVKAETMAIANENGRLIFNSIFKRIWRSLKLEFKKLYRLNQFFQGDESFTFGESNFEIKKNDYQFPDSGIVPAADPNIISTTERRQVAQLVMQTAQSVPGHNMPEVVKRFYEAHNVPGIEIIYDPQKFPPQPNPKMLELQLKGHIAENKRLDSQGKHQIAIAKVLNDIELTQAKIYELNAKAAMELKQAEGVERGHAIALLDAMIGAESKHRDHLLGIAELMMGALKDGHGSESVQSVEKPTGDKGVLPMAVALQANGNGGMGQAPPPQ